MRGLVYNNGVLAGFLEREANGQFRFEYENQYYADRHKKAISLTLPKSERVHFSNQLFAFFFGLLSEGVNKDIQCRALRIDENDHFRRLLSTAGQDTIGAITVKPE